MDPALKKRLIGASVLIIAAIIFLPMLFDGSAPVTGDVQPIDIPLPPERDFSTRVVALDAPIPPSGLAAALAAPGSDTAAPVTTTDPTTPAADQVTTIDAPVSVRSDALPEDLAVAAAKPAPVAVTPTVSPTLAPIAPVQPATAAAPTALASTTSNAPVPASAGRFMVNLGSYASAANAEQLASSLKSAGLVVHSASVNVAGKPALRLQLGPFASRAQAENARLKAKAVRADLPLQIIEIDDSPSADVTAPSPARGGVAAFAVQVAVLGDIAKANATRDQLRAAGFAAFVEQLQTDKGTVYRLRVGPEAARSDAEKVQAGIKQRFGFAAIIVAYP
jgi:DedD protein